MLLWNSAVWICLDLNLGTWNRQYCSTAGALLLGTAEHANSRGLIQVLPSSSSDTEFPGCKLSVAEPPFVSCHNSHSASWPPSLKSASCGACSKTMSDPQTDVPPAAPQSEPVQHSDVIVIAESVGLSIPALDSSEKQLKQEPSEDKVAAKVGA